MNAWQAIALATIAGCTWGTPPEPSVTAVDPPVVANDQDAILVIRGAGFVPSVEVDFDDPSRGELSPPFRGELRRGGPPVALEDVTVVSSTDLRGRLPASTLPGDWDVVVIAPSGAEATLRGGLKVRGTTCVVSNGPCDDRNPCTEADACQGLTCEPGPALPDGTGCGLVCIDRTIPGECVSGSCVTASGC